MKERILINIFSHNVGRIIEMLLGLLIVPFLIKALGVTGFGLIVVAESLFYFFWISATGLKSALGRYVGMCIFQNKKEEANSYIATAEGILLFIMLFVLIIGAVVSYYCTSIFTVPFEYSAQMKTLVLLIVLSFVLQISFTSSWAVVFSFQRFDLLNIYGALRNIIRCLLVFAVYLTLKPKLYYYGLIYFIAVFVEQLFIMRCARRLFPEIVISTQQFSWAKVKELSSFMGFQTIGAVSGILYGHTDMLLINKFLGPYFNAVYSISLKFVNILKRLIQQSLWVLQPSFTELVARKEKERIEHIYVSVTKVTALFALPICILLGFFGKEAIFIWVGKEFVDAVNPMYVHILAALPVLIFSATGGVLIAYAKIKIPSFMTLCCAVANVFISLFCALKLGWGLVGFAFGTLLSRLIFNLTFMPFYACRVAKISFRDFYCNSLLKPLFLSGIFGLVVYYLKFILMLPLGYVFVCLFLATPVYCYLSYVLILNSYEKNKIKEIIKIIFDIFSQKKAAIKNLMEN